MLLFVELLVFGYIVFLILAFFLAFAALPHGYRGAFFKLSAVVPFVAIFALLKTIVSVKNESVRFAYSDGLMSTEERIESKRVEIFGGKRLDPYNDRLASTEERIESKGVEIFGGTRLDPSMSAPRRLTHSVSLERAVRATVKMSRKLVGLDGSVPAYTR